MVFIVLRFGTRAKVTGTIAASLGTIRMARTIGNAVDQFEGACHSAIIIAATVDTASVVLELALVYAFCR